MDLPNLSLSRKPKMALIEKVAQANPNTIVILENRYGGDDALDQTKSTVWWRPGMPAARGGRSSERTFRRGESQRQAGP